MPTAPPSRCTTPGCHAMATTRGRCPPCQPPPWQGRPPKTARYGGLTAGRWRTLKRAVGRRDLGHCYRCGAEPPGLGPNGEEPPGYHLDHITPVSEGGSPDDLDNLGLICPSCDTVKTRAERERGNARKHARRRSQRRT